MNVTLVVHGTRGDVQPFAAVALSLMERGHDVTLAVPVNLVPFVQKCGIKAEKLAIDTQDFLESEDGRKWLASGDLTSFMKSLDKIYHEHRDESIEDVLRACKGADLIVGSLLTEDFTSSVAEQMGIPFVSLHLVPFRPTAAFPNSLVTLRDLPFGVLNRATHKLVENVWWKGKRGDVNVLRARIGLSPANRPTPRRLAANGSYTVNAFSPLLVPKPADWDETMPVVGAIRFPAQARARLGEATRDPELGTWLGAGKPPVYFGFGSMPVNDPAEMLRTVSEIARKCDERVIVGAGWSSLEAAAALPDDVRIVGAVDHEWLLPQCSGAVHHGGAGTTHAVLSAGLPAVVCSVFADQPFWGARVERLGAGVHLPFKNLNPTTLEASVRRVSTLDMRNAAAKLGASLRTEPDAAPHIASLIELIGSNARPRSAA